MRYFIYFSYDGSKYHGWQIQPNGITVQSELNRCLGTLLKQDISTTGAGRTDAGVHARMMVAHFDAEPPIDDTAGLTRKLNRFLPADIAVNHIVPVRSEAHARFDAVSRTYYYWIYSKKNPFRQHYAARVFLPLDFTAMNEAAKALLTVRDFTSFSKLHTDTKTNICRVTRAFWIEEEEDLWRFEITADRFLRNMVRAIVGTLVQVGTGRMSIEEFLKVVAEKNRCAAGDSMPGHALSLVNIVYNRNIFL